jgi:hypothetical protein
VTRTEEAQAAPRSLRSWLMRGVRKEHPAHLAQHPSPHQTEKTHHWWQVMCLTGDAVTRPSPEADSADNNPAPQAAPRNEPVETASERP